MTLLSRPWRRPIPTAFDLLRLQAWACHAAFFGVRAETPRAVGAADPCTDPCTVPGADHERSTSGRFETQVSRRIAWTVRNPNSRSHARLSPCVSPRSHHWSLTSAIQSHITLGTTTGIHLVDHHDITLPPPEFQS